MPSKDNDKPVSFQPLPDDEIYREAYANNVLLESSAWDLKLIFGQLDQRGGKVAIRQHTAITIPWAQAKIFSYWLRSNIESQEVTNGKIILPNALIPGEIQPPTEEQKAQDPSAMQIYEIFTRLRQELVEDQKK
jgi:hypothetical protein